MYSTPLDVRNALTPGADPQDASTASSLEDAQVEDAIREADTLIDSYLANIYTIPGVEIEVDEGPPPVLVTVAPQPVRYWSRDIAAYLATLTYKRHKDVPVDDPVRLRYNMVMAVLERVASGEYTLPFDPPDPTSPGPGGVVVENVYNGHLFDLQDFGIGPASLRNPRTQDLGWNRAETW